MMVVITRAVYLLVLQIFGGAAYCLNIPRD